jgi:RND family efflux transporter MFP subunit
MEAASVRLKKVRKQRITSIIVIALVAIIVVVGVILFLRSRKQNPLAGMVTATVGRSTITQKISATGTVDAQTGAQVNIGSQVTGTIKNLYVDIGTKVTAGQVIAVLNSPDVEAQYNQAVAALNVAQLAYDQQVSGVGFQQTTTSSDINKAQSGLASAQATYNQDYKTLNAQVQSARAAINQAQATYQNAVTFLNREKQLLAKGYVATQDVDNAQTAANVAQAQLDSANQNLQLVQTKTSTALQTDLAAVHNAQAILAAAKSEIAQNIIKNQQVASAKAAVKQAQDNVAYWNAQFQKTIIHTPISGTITTLSAQQGETVAAGLAAPTLVTVVNLERLQVDAYVDETDIGGVRLSLPASVTVDAYPNKTFPGRVVKIAAGGTLQQNVVSYDTTIALSNPRGLLKPAMTATATIITGQHTDVISVPIEAIKYIGTTPVVYVVQSDKTIVPRRVTTGISDDVNTEILSGVKPGETIVLAGYPPNGQMPRFGLFGPGSQPSGRPSGGGAGGPGGGAGRGGGAPR